MSPPKLAFFIINNYLHTEICDRGKVCCSRGGRPGQEARPASRSEFKAPAQTRRPRCEAAAPCKAAAAVFSRPSTQVLIKYVPSVSHNAILQACLRYEDIQAAQMEAVWRLARCIGAERLKSELHAAGRKRVIDHRRALTLAISLLEAPPALQPDPPDPPEPSPQQSPQPSPQHSPRLPARVTAQQWQLPSAASLALARCARAFADAQCDLAPPRISRFRQPPVPVPREQWTRRRRRRGRTGRSTEGGVRA